MAIETPHVIVENLSQDTIEDTIDNLMTLGVFESVFALVSQDEPVAEGALPTPPVETTTSKG